MKQRRNWLLLLVVTLIVILADQISKALVVANLSLYEEWAPIESLRSVFTFTYVQNTGAAFGILPDGGAFFVIVALIVIGIILYFYRQLPDSTPLIRVALGLQLGGALGNLLDRVRLGYVVDFFDFKFWPVFNIADSCVVVGAIALVILMWWDERRTAKAEALKAASDAEHPPSGSPPPSEEEPTSIQ
jgi:signal peptidase II